MKPSDYFPPTRSVSFFLVTLICFLLLPSGQAGLLAKPEKEYQPASGEFDVLGKAVVELLKSHDTDGFATNLSVTAEDWQSIITNASGEEADRLKTFAKGTGYNVQRLKADAKALLSRADSLHLDFPPVV